LKDESWKRIALEVVVGENFLGFVDGWLQLRCKATTVEEEEHQMEELD